tara:strand:- start:5452 stop:6390 length:939 start_codon:yes stop_codon:yes gene_type:complete
MAEEKKSFLIYTNLLETLEYQSNEVAGELFKHMLLYVNDRNPVSDNPLINALFIPIKQKMKFDLDKWEGKKEGYSKAGKMSSLSKSHKDLHSKVKADEMKLEEALKIAETRKEVKTTVEPILKPSKVVKPKLDTTKREEQFLKFWDIYDRKDDKKKCLEKFLKLTDKQVEKIASTIIRYVEVNNVREFRKKPIKYLINENWNDEIEDQAIKPTEINQGFKNSLATRQNIISLFESDDLTILIEKYKTNKKYLRKRLDEFIYIKSKEKDFGSKTAISQYQYYINHLKHNEPVIVNNVDPNAEAPWVTYAKKHN